MSLYKQLWIAVAVLMLTVFGVTFVINSVSSSHYLEEQLSVRNDDSATALALSLSQQTLDPVALEIQLSAQLDLANYEWIELRASDGRVLFSRENTPPSSQSPAWFRSWFDIDSIAGSASISNGWSQVGTLSLKSFEDFAYDELWAGAKRTGIALVVAVLVAGAVGSLLLRAILAPLRQVVEQASAIGERRFVTLPEPLTAEFAQVTRSMNELSRRVRDMLEREAQRLERQREANEMDAVSGLMMRRPILARLRGLLQSEGSDASGSVVLIRVNDLLRMNQHYGRQTMDTVLHDVGMALRHLLIGEDSWSAGRLNGSDFCLLAPHERDTKVLAERVKYAVNDVLSRYEMQERTTLPTAGIEYASDDVLAEILTALDGALLASEHQQGAPVTIASRRSTSALPLREQAEHWRNTLSKVLAAKHLTLECFPVLGSKGDLLHREGMVRLNFQGETLKAGTFMPWVYRLDLSGEVDRAVILSGLDEIELRHEPLHVHLSATSLTDLTFSIWLEEQLLRKPRAAEQLSIEVGESIAYSHPEGFRRLRHHARSQGTQVGIEHMGFRLGDIGKLGEMGADFLKIDAMFIREIDRNSGNQALLRTYVAIAQSLGIPCFAEGVENTSELRTVIDLGCGGVTGPGVRLLQAKES